MNKKLIKIKYLRYNYGMNKAFQLVWKESVSKDSLIETAAWYEKPNHALKVCICLINRGVNRFY